MRELIVDNFAGGGGASTAMEQATGRSVDIAINHSPEAIAMHSANHPDTLHLCEDVFSVDPVKITSGQPVGLAWFSPDCTHHSKARGGKPKDKNIRGLAWVAVEWAIAGEPRVIILENVEEFQDWGPLLPDGTPCPARKGIIFHQFVKSLRGLGYVVDWKELVACDYGAPTTRKRLFLVARRDGRPIVWPKPTHGARDSAAVLSGDLLPWRAAAECIDWSIPAPSIFLSKEEGKKLGVRRPLVDATCRRIAKGVMRYVVDNPDPFIVTYYGDKNGEFRGQSLHDPLATLTTENRHGLVVPHLVGIDNQSAGSGCTWDGKKPLTTITTENRHALVSTFLAKHYTGVVGSKVEDPLGTITSVDHHSVVAAHMVRPFGQSVGQSPANPAPTVMPGGAGKTGIVTSNLVKLRGSNVGQDNRDPLQTITAGGNHFGEVRAFLMKYYGTDQAPKLERPLDTITTKERFGIVTVQGADYQIIDIGMRMLQPRELFLAQGFPAEYIINPEFNGKPLTKGAQVRMCGNSVSPFPAKALVEANYQPLEITQRRPVRRSRRRGLREARA